VVDESRDVSRVPVQRARRLLDAYSRQIGSLRLLARGVNPEVVRTLAIDTVDVSTPQSQAASFLGLMPYFLIFSVFIGGMYLAIDSTAGERERGSLEPLLMNPVARSELVLGKLSAVLVFTLVAVVETLVAFAVVLDYLPLESMIGVSMSLSPSSLVKVLLIVIPMLPLAAAIQLIIASFTRSFKEAQNYLSLLPLVPALPGLFLTFMPVKPKLWAMLIPTFGQQLLINQVMRGEALSVLFVAVSAAVTSLVALVFVLGAIRLYERERILFGRGQ
jgi:sodium transport system permease protein